MNISRLRIFSFAAVVATVAFAACKDDFSEIEFLKLQNQLAMQKDSLENELAMQKDSAFLKLENDLAMQKDSVELLTRFKANGAETQAQAASYVAALNEAGDLLGVSILVREDNKAVEGVSVSINTVSSPATTNASGIAYFDRVRIGEATVMLSKANYASASALVTFGTPSVPQPQTVSANGVTTTRYVAPAKRFENIGLPLFAVGGTGSTATIRGRVTYERDLTNQIPEIPRFLPAGGGTPTPITIQANLRAALAPIIVTSSSTGGNAEVLTYQIADGAFGSSTVDLITGNYSMVVPASVGGINGYSLIIPEITENQTLAINGAPDATGIAVPLANGPELRSDVPTRWSSNYAADNSPSVPSAFLYFPEPPPAGRGFAPDFTAVARPIDLGTYGDVTNSNQEIVNNTIIRFNNRGQGFTSSPTVTFSAPISGTTTASASIRGYVSAVNVAVGGNGFAGPGTVFIEFNQTAPNAAGLATTSALGGVERLAVEVLASGSLRAGSVTLPTTTGYTASSQFTTDPNMTALGFRIMSAANGGVEIANATAQISITRATELNAIHITSAGTYSSAPTITLNGGSATTQPSAVVQEYRVKWQMAFPASAPTIPYRVLPAGLSFSFPAFGTTSSLSNSNAEVVGLNGNIVSNAGPLLDRVATDGTTITPRPEFSSSIYQTSTFWHVAPQLIITDATRTRATGSIFIDNTTGRVTGTNITSPGAGYDEATFRDATNGISIRPTFVGAPGTGVTLNLAISVQAASRAATLTGVTVNNNGSGYKSAVNTFAAGFSSDPIPAVRTGQTYNVDVRLGTGDRPAGYN